jgi:glutamate synthase domain-containing protein 1
MSHRGGCGCEPNTGDGAGTYLVQTAIFYNSFYVLGSLTKESWLECLTRTIAEF